MDTVTAATLLTTTATGWGLTASYAHRQHRLARTDTLTGLATRDVLTTLVHRAARHRRGVVGLVMLDIDRFKTINDTHGHEIGNHVLTTLAGRLTRLAGPGERAIRLHGDEFALWLGLLPAPPGIAPADIDIPRRRAAAVHTAMADPITLPGRRLTVTVSTGPAALPADGLTLTALLAAADHALYHAKQATYQATGTPLPTPASTAAAHASGRWRDARKHIA